MTARPATQSPARRPFGRRAHAGRLRLRAPEAASGGSERPSLERARSPSRTRRGEVEMRETWSIVTLISGAPFAAGVLPIAWERAPAWRAADSARFRVEFAHTLRRVDRLQPALLLVCLVSSVGFAVSTGGTARALAGLAASCFLADRAAGRGREDEPRGRRGALPQPEDGRIPPHSDVPQARYPFARRAGPSVHRSGIRPASRSPSRGRRRRRLRSESNTSRRRGEAECRDRSLSLCAQGTGVPPRRPLMACASLALVAPRRSARGGSRRSRGHSDAVASSGSRGPLEPVDPGEAGEVG